ncbi:MAG: hypothetical protein U0936_18335 [Planctomycetaceae bacterium]
MAAFIPVMEEVLLRVMIAKVNGEMTAALTLEDIQYLSEEVRHLVRAMPLEKSADAGRGRGRRLQQLTQAIPTGSIRGSRWKHLSKRKRLLRGGCWLRLWEPGFVPEIWD